MDTKHDRAFSRPSRHRGVTLIEMAIVIVVTAVVASLATPSMRELIDSRRLLGAANQLAADVQLARTEAVSRNRGIRLSFHAATGSSCYVIHTGTAAQCSCADDGPAVCTGGAHEIKSVVIAASDRVTVGANVASILFDPLHGTSTPSGTLRVADVRGRAVHHVVNVVGRIRSCSPGAAVAGFRAC
ncbi:MAG: GspH/FimT family pseudopilin [Caldimonas sp.]